MTRPSLETIAQACGGVSKATVSMALRDNPKISKPTRDRIRKAAQDLGYESNRRISKVMSEIRSGTRKYFKETIGYLTQDPGGYEQKIFTGVRTRAHDLGYQVDRFVISDAEKPGTLDRTLSARGIRGVIIPPFNHPHGSLDLRWKEYCSVTIGHSLTQPNLYRINRDHQLTIEQACIELADRGYQRFGFVMEKEHEARMNYSNLSNFTANQWRIPRWKSLPPLLPDSLTRSEFHQWFRKHQPDLILAMNPQLETWLHDLRLKVPEDVSLFLLNTSSKTSRVSGIYPNYEILGASALEQVIGLLERAEFGIPTIAKRILVDGTWVEGTTIRPRTMPPKRAGSQRKRRT